MFERTREDPANFEAVNISGTWSKNMKSLIKRFAKDESGATAIEYGLIAGLLSIVILGVLGLTGGSLNDVFTRIQAALAGAAAG